MQTYTDLSGALKEPDKVQILDLKDQGLTDNPCWDFSTDQFDYTFSGRKPDWGNSPWTIPTDQSGFFTFTV